MGYINWWFCIKVKWKVTVLWLWTKSDDVMCMSCINVIFEKHHYSLDWITSRTCFGPLFQFQQKVKSYSIQHRNVQEIHLLKYNKNFCQLNVSVFLQNVFMAFWSAFLTWLVNCLDQSTENHWKSLLMDFRFFSFFCITWITKHCHWFWLGHFLWSLSIYRFLDGMNLLPLIRQRLFYPLGWRWDWWLFMQLLLWVRI